MSYANGVKTFGLLIGMSALIVFIVLAVLVAIALAKREAQLGEPLEGPRVIKISFGALS